METVSQSHKDMVQWMLDSVLIEYVPILQPGTRYPMEGRHLLKPLFDDTMLDAMYGRERFRSVK
jgi:hypothetical protein